MLYPPELRGHESCSTVGDGWKIVEMSYTNGCLFASSFHFITRTTERQPGYFMNCCRETMKMGVPRAAQALAPRAGQPQGVGFRT